MNREENAGELPWDIKSLKLSLGGDADGNGFITFKIFDDNRFNIYINEQPTGGADWACDDIHIEAARRLRDFLNWAVPNVK